MSLPRIDDACREAQMLSPREAVNMLAISPAGRGQLFELLDMTLLETTRPPQRRRRASRAG